MCGRYSLTTPVEEMRRLFGFAGPAPNLGPRYNIAPTQDISVVRRADADEASAEGTGGRMLAALRWGLVPSWARDPAMGPRLINARAETVAQKPAFRAAFEARRCLIPADGFYEWRRSGRNGRGREPYRICLADEAAFAFAGLWELWIGPDGAALESCAVITCDANALVAPIHDRMPVILDPADHAAWLGEGGISAADAQALLRPFPAGAMRAYPVSTRVNSPRNDDARCFAPREDAPRLL